MHDARKIANLILDHIDSECNSITNLKINKMLYFVHGWYFARRRSPLIKNHFEAWPLGPVVSVVYNEFKRFEDSPVKSRAKHINYATGDLEHISWLDMETSDTDFILKVAGFYSRYSALQLVDLTHQHGSPWHEVMNQQQNARGMRNRIPNSLILAHFLKLAGDRRPS